MAYLGVAKVPMQIDIGIGDAVVPPPAEVIYPTLLDHEAPRLKAYRKETVVAEKLHAIVTHGMQNTRMKDYFDLYFLSQHFAFTYSEVVRAVEATFARRGTTLPKELPLGLTTTFSEEALKKTQWHAFLRKMTKEQDTRTLSVVVDSIVQFIAPILGGDSNLVEWKARGPWS
jgi:predicted nucleotidyltransferase component of viral defense system